MDTIVAKLAREYRKRQSNFVKKASREELLNSEKWVLTDELDQVVYGKLTVLLKGFNLMPRLEECLKKGFIHFDVRHNEENGFICGKRIRYAPDSDFSSVGVYWSE